MWGTQESTQNLKQIEVVHARALPYQPLENRVMRFSKHWVSEESLLECPEQSSEKEMSGAILGSNLLKPTCSRSNRTNNPELMGSHLQIKQIPALATPCFLQMVHCENEIITK